MFTRRYRDLNSFLRQRFGCRVQKISLDAGLTCPNRDGTVGLGGCIYCNALGSGTGLARNYSIRQQLELGKQRLQRRYGAKKFIAYFQSFSNTYAAVDRLRQLYLEALSVKDVVGLAIGTRPDCVADEVLDLLAEINERTYLWLEYGLQSIHDRSLVFINRGHTVAAFVDAVERTRLRGLDICVHVILGLPGEGKAEMLQTARALGCLDIQAVKIHLLYVIKDTPLAMLYSQGSYQCLSRDQYVDIVCDFLAYLPPQVVIHRLTGDPHPEELVAPMWALEKQTNLQAIWDTMEERNLWQGKYLE
ncbi:MAG: TIGR01212 family radical SAM protein [Deltaproteobacteria bacterium]|nr:TIGR01212 family radical SAM protein [Deltaproteobacteria bacterium]MBW2071391.1 TIGR01212 family radical SAM protein [Deltaproteobacteria bacterium]